MPRYCAFDDKEVKPMTEAKREWGKGETTEGFLHMTEPNCGRRIIREDQTYTEAELDPTQDDSIQT